MPDNHTKKGQLSQGERQIIEILRKNGKGKSCREIGKELNRDHTVISREIERNGTDVGYWTIHYSAEEAEKKRLARRKKANRGHVKLLQDPAMLRRFEKIFEEKHRLWGVDEIVGIIRKSGEEMVCTSTVYNFIHCYKREWEYRLRHGKHGYKKRKGNNKKTALVGVPLIEERSEDINNRITFGDWEVDMIVGPKGEKGGLLTIVERLTRFTIIVKLTRATKKEVTGVITKALSKYNVHSITSDNGSEFAGLAEVGKALGCEVFRCHPYASREKGSNERNNGIIRWFCPKGLSIQQYSEEYIKEVETNINSKPRKILGYTTALIVFTYYLNEVI